VNTSEGAVAVERSTIHIGNLRFDVKKADLEKLFRQKQIATPLDITMKIPHKSDDKKKPFALVEFHRSSEAQDAIAILDELEWPKKKGRRLRVKWAKESRTSVHPGPPLVVNGSGTLGDLNEYQ